MQSFVHRQLPELSFRLFLEVCCSIVGFFELLTHLGYDIFELLGPRTEEGDKMEATEEEKLVCAILRIPNTLVKALGQK